METGWTPEITKRLIELAAQRRAYGAPNATEMSSILAEEFGVFFTKDAINNKIRREGFSEPEQPVFMPYYQKYIEGIQNPPKKIAGLSLSGRKKILHLCDFHTPYQDYVAISQAVNMAAGADAVVMSEVMDLESQSSFTIFKPAPLEEEIETTLALLEYISGKFPVVYILASNHDLRVQRRIAKLLPGELQRLIDDINIIELLSRPFANIIPINNWWLKIGDVLFCHASQSTQISMKSASELDTYFLSHNVMFRVLIQAHTHSLGVLYRNGRKLFEGGMLCKVLDYYKAKPSKSAWTQGFVVVELEDGQAILDRCREYYVPLDEERKEASSQEKQNAKAWQINGDVLP